MYTIVLFNSWWSINLYSIEAAHTPEDIVHITPPGEGGGGGTKTKLTGIIGFFHKMKYPWRWDDLLHGETIGALHVILKIYL